MDTTLTLDLAGSIALLLWGVVQSSIQRAFGPISGVFLGDRFRAFLAGLGGTADECR